MTSTLSGEDTLLCVFNQQNKFVQEINLTPAIYNKYYFRILSTRTCLLKISFARQNYILNSDGTISQSDIFIAGDKTIYYSCSDQNLSTGRVELVDPIADTEISVIFEFKETRPIQYYLE